MLFGIIIHFQPATVSDTWNTVNSNTVTTTTTTTTTKAMIIHLCKCVMNTKLQWSKVRLTTTQCTYHVSLARRCQLILHLHLMCSLLFNVHRNYYYTNIVSVVLIKNKVLPYSLLSVGPGADPGVQAVSQVTLSHPPAVSCHYFPPDLQSPSQAKNVTVLRPVPNYTAWWQRHIGVNNWCKVVVQLCPDENRTHVLMTASPTIYLYSTVPLH